jgi:lysophospholipase L1-like esterase
MTQILAFGHSVTYGKGDTEGGWTQRLDRELKNFNIENKVYNLGIPGNTTKQLLDRSEELNRRIYPEADALILIQIGANDLQKEEGELRVPPRKFEENLQKIISKAKDLSNHVMLIGDGYTTIEDSLPWAPEKKVKDERAKKYHLIREKVAEKEETRYLSIRRNWTKEKWKSYLHDGVHPNNRGHQEIRKMVSKELEKKKYPDLKT